MQKSCSLRVLRASKAFGCAFPLAIHPLRASCHVATSVKPPGLPLPFVLCVFPASQTGTTVPFALSCLAVLIVSSQWR